MTSRSVYCSNCGKQMMASFRVCPACGGTAFADTPPRLPAGPASTPPPSFRQQAPASPSYQPASSGSGSGFSAGGYRSAGPVVYAGFWRRFAACVIDTLVVTFVVIVVGALFGALAGTIFASAELSDFALDRFINSPVFSGLLQVLAVIFNWLYFALQEASATQATLGKRALGIKVTDLSGQRISFGRATGRYFAKIISSIFLGIGFIMVAFTQRKQGWHDKLAETLVVKA